MSLYLDIYDHWLVHNLSLRFWELGLEYLIQTSRTPSKSTPSGPFLLQYPLESRPGPGGRRRPVVGASRSLDSRHSSSHLPSLPNVLQRIPNKRNILKKFYPFVLSEIFNLLFMFNTFPLQLRSLPSSFKPLLSVTSPLYPPLTSFDTSTSTQTPLPVLHSFGERKKCFVLWRSLE